MDHVARQQLAACVLQEILAYAPADFALVGKRKSQFDEVMVQVRYPRLYGRSHAHLVLLQEQCGQVGLELEIEQTVEKGALARGYSKFLEEFTIIVGGCRKVETARPRHGLMPRQT